MIQFQSIWYWTHHQFVDSAVCKHVASPTLASADATVTLILEGQPRPAFIWPTLVDLGPESLL